jgi:hypothetical protein
MDLRRDKQPRRHIDRDAPSAYASPAAPSSLLLHEINGDKLGLSRFGQPGPDHFDLTPVLNDLPDHHGRIWFAPGALSDQRGHFKTRYKLPGRDSAFLAPLVSMPGDEKRSLATAERICSKSLPMPHHSLARLSPKELPGSTKTVNRGVIAGDGYQCFPHAPGRVRRPDVSFIRRGRLPGDVSPKGWVRIPPDLVVEVISPNDAAEELEEKLRYYRKVQVLLVWVIYPELRVAKVLRVDGPPAELEEGDVLSAGEVLPGFRCPLRDILPRITAVEESRTPSADPSGPGPS